MVDSCECLVRETRRACFSFIASLAMCITVSAETPDEILRGLLRDRDVLPLAPVVQEPESLVELGRSLFFDHELSGNRDISCATCHHPSATTGDARAMPAGVGTTGLANFREQSQEREVVPRNSPELFQRGDEAFTTMFWDSRVAIRYDQSGLTSPAGDALPEMLEGVLETQAMFPVTSRAEMRGDAGDLDIFGRVNEIALIDDTDLPAMWSALTERLMSIPAYRGAFAEAYPHVPLDDIGFEHAAKAIAAFEKMAFSPRDSAWDRYLAGDNSALTDAAKRGATHFLSGNCASCHSGSLLTDQQHHNLGVPQLGPGKDASGLDIGHALVSGEAADKFGFRTPPLRNVMITGPWMHNGAFTSLEDVLRHHYDPEGSLSDYDVSQLPDHLRDTVKLDQETIKALTATLDPKLPIGDSLTQDQLNDMMAFLFSLTSPSTDLMLEIPPSEVLSGLEVDLLPPSQIGVVYDPGSGALQLVGEADLSLDALFLRIHEDETGQAAGFAFTKGMAPWSGDEDIILSDLADAQAFLDYRASPAFLFGAGDQLTALLPPGLSPGEVTDHLTAAYRIHGYAELWQASVTTIPEPWPTTLLFIGLMSASLVRRRIAGFSRGAVAGR